MSDKVKVVLVGCGRIATLHTRGYQNNPLGELHGVYDKNPGRAKEFAAEHGVGRVYASFEEVLADPAVDAVELLVPHHLHREMAVQAAKAKKHVSVQKPMAMNLAECDEMIAAAEENGVLLKVFENFVFYPPYVKAKALFDAGEIGEAVGVRYKMTNAGLGSRGVPGAKGRAKKAGVNLGEDLPETGWEIGVESWLWRLNDTLSGGGPLVFDDGYHKFSVLLDLLGDVEKVNAWIDETAVLPGVYQDCPGVIMFKYRDKKVYGVFEIMDAKDMFIESKYYNCDERLELTGSRGVVWVTRCTGTLMPTVAPVVMYRDGKLTEFWDMPCDWGDSFAACTRDFVESIAEKRQPRLSGLRGKEVLQFALAAIDSSKQGCEIHLEQYQDKALKKQKGILSVFGKKK